MLKRAICHEYWQEQCLQSHFPRGIVSTSAYLRWNHLPHLSHPIHCSVLLVSDDEKLKDSGHIIDVIHLVLRRDLLVAVLLFLPIIWEMEKFLINYYHLPLIKLGVSCSIVHIHFILDIANNVNRPPQPL